LNKGCALDFGRSPEPSKDATEGQRPSAHQAAKPKTSRDEIDFYGSENLI
jgi:hypothetical protein